jgi:hypothetical protein
MNNINLPAQIRFFLRDHVSRRSNRDHSHSGRKASRIEIWKRRFPQRDVSKGHEISLRIIDLQRPDRKRLFPSFLHDHVPSILLMNARHDQSGGSSSGIANHKFGLNLDDLCSIFMVFDTVQQGARCHFPHPL